MCDASKQARDRPVYAQLYCRLVQDRLEERDTARVPCVPRVHRDTVCWEFLLEDYACERKACLTAVSRPLPLPTPYLLPYRDALVQLYDAVRMLWYLINCAVLMMCCSFWCSFL